MHLNPPPRPDPAPEDPGDAPRTPAAAPSSELHVWLIRHGEVDRTFATQAYGSRDVPLSERGQEQTQTTAEALAHGSIDRVVTSPLSRARALGEAIAQQTRAPLREHRGLIELDRGQWQTLTRTEYQARWDLQAQEYWSDPGHWRGHGGESEWQLSERTWAAFEESCRGAKRVAIAAHRNVIRSILATALGLPFGRSHALALEPCCGALLGVEGDRWVLKRFGIGAYPTP